MYIDPKLVRSAYIGKQYKDIFEGRKLSISEFAEKIGTSQPNLSNALNGKKSFSDKFFTKVGKALSLSDREIKNIFKEAAVEEFMFEFGDMIPGYKEMTLEEGLEWLEEKASLAKEQIIAIRAILELKKKED